MCVLGFLIIGGMTAVSAYTMWQIAHDGSLAWMILPTLYVVVLYRVVKILEKKQVGIIPFKGNYSEDETIDAEVVDEDDSPNVGQNVFNMYVLYQRLRLLRWLRNAIIVCAVLYVLLKIIQIILMGY